MSTHDQITGEQVSGGALAAGQKLGPYEVLGQVGSGGMGIVWRAHDRLLGRDVAIKQLAAAEAADELTRRRFRQEGELQKTLSQQCDRLVEVLEVMNEGGGLFIVMEYIQGVSLEQVLAQHRDPIEPVKVLSVVRDVAKALTAMHAEGVVHRDLKPGNILLAPSGAKVGDFGLAALVEQQEALPMGTAAYMAPELFGEGPIDGRADLYALGLIAYEMLIGRANYEQAFRAVLRDKRNRAVRWMKWHTNVRAKVAPVAQHAPNVPTLVADLVDRLMAKELSRRFQSAEQLLATIERHFMRPATPPTTNGQTNGNGHGAAHGTTGNGTATGPASGDGAAAERPMAPSSGGEAAPDSGVAGLNGRSFPQPRPMPAAANGTHDAATLAPVPATQAAPAFAADGEDQTAPLPQRSRLVPVLIGLAVLNVLLLGGLWAYHQHQQGQAAAAEAATAEETFATAMNAFDAGRYDEAHHLWDGLAQQWNNHPQFGVGAGAYASLASAMAQTQQANEAMTAGDYDTALQAYRTARGAVNQADDLVHSHEAARVAASRLIRRIQTLQEDVPNRTAFVRQVKVIADAVDEADFDDARQHLRDLHRTLTATAGALTRTETRKLDELSTMIEDRAVRHRILQVDEKAQRMIDRGELEEAREVLSEAQEQFEDHQLRDRLSEVSQRIAYTSAMADAESARRAGDLHAAAAALDRAYEIEASAELEDRLLQMRSDAALADGREAKAQGDFDAAARHLLESISHWRNEEAQKLLNEVQGAGEVQAIIQAAEAAENGGDYAQAVNLYRRAIRLVDDPRTQTKLNAAMVRKHTSDARDALERGDLDRAREAVAEARQVNREDEEVKRLRELVAEHEAITALREEGESQREVSRFGRAKATYRQAIERAEEAGIDPEALRQRHLEIELDHLVAQARAASEAKQWAEARAYLRVALRMKHSEQIQQMLREVEQKAADEEDDD